MATSIIIVNYNTKDLLNNCIKSIYATQKNSIFEIIIIDNNSKDDSKTLQKIYPQTRWIFNKENYGFGYANNQGVAISKYENILLLNSDTILEIDILTELESFMKDHPKCGGISPQILFEDKSPQSTYGNYPTVQFFLLNAIHILPLLPHKLYNKLAIGLPVTFNTVQKVPHILGVAMFIRKSAFNEVNGFDENFFLYFEETDLCCRIKEKDYDFFVLPSIYVLHLLGKSSPTNTFKTMHLLRSRIYYFKKRRTKNLWLIYILSYIKLFILSLKYIDFKYLKLFNKL